MLSKNEEDYLKALFHLEFESDQKKVGMNQLADYLGITPASANNMIKKLKRKELVHHEKYGKLGLTEYGKDKAINLIRKHRLWETFLYDKLEFSWDEVHEVAEQLEHIRSQKLIQKLDKFLGYPETDPHGDPIPDAKGHIKPLPKLTLSEVPIGSVCNIVTVNDNSTSFLQYVSELGLGIDSQVKVIDRQSFDNSICVKISDKEVRVSEKFAQNIYVIVL